MLETKRCVFIAILSNAGGEGKTLLARMLKALFELQGLAVQLFDGDPGNFAAKISDMTAMVIGWGVGALKAKDIVRATMGQHVLFDLGANSMASSREIVDLLPALQREFAGAGYETIALLPVSTNKVGSVEAIIELEAKIQDFKKIFVKVNRDGSNSFDPGLEGRSVIHVGHLEPGLQKYVNGPGKSLIGSITEPPADYETAATFVAKWLRDFAAQPLVRFIVGNAVPLLDLHAPTTPPSIRFQVTDLSQAKNKALKEMAERTRILDAIDDAGWSPDGLVAAAINLRTSSYRKS